MLAPSSCKRDDHHGHQPAPIQGVLVEEACLVVFAQDAQVVRQVVGRAEGVGVIVTKDPTVRSPR
jgi:hypothetical protein